MRVLTVVFVLTVSFVSLACSVAPSVAPSQGVTGGPRQGGTLVSRFSQDFWNFDMSDAGQSQPNGYGIRLAYNSLLRLKTGPEVKYYEYVVEPSLAEAWEVSPDARTFTFHLRKGLKFAPSLRQAQGELGSGNEIKGVNGRELTSADVKWSYEYWARAGQFKDLPVSQAAWMFEGLDAISAPDPSTVAVRFKDAFSPFLIYASSSLNPIVPKEIYEQDGHLKEKMVGTGAYQLDTATSQKGSRWVFKRNPDYWEPGKPYIDEVRFLVLKDESAAQAAFQTKQLDHFAVTTTTAAEEIRKANPNAVVFDYMAVPLMVFLQSNRPPFNDRRLRLAVSRAIDREEFARVFTQSKGRPALSGENATDLFSREEIAQIVPYKPDEAKRFLAEAGHPQGLDVPAMLPTDLNEAIIQETQLLQAQLKKAGINLQLETLPYSDVSARRKRHDYWVSTSGEFPRPDVDAWLYSTFFPGARANYDEISDPKLAELLVAQRREVDAGKRRTILRETIRYINESGAGIGIYRRPAYIIWQPYLKDYFPQQDIQEGVYGAWPAWLDK